MKGLNRQIDETKEKNWQLENRKKGLFSRIRNEERRVRTNRRTSPDRPAPALCHRISKREKNTN